MKFHWLRAVSSFVLAASCKSSTDPSANRLVVTWSAQRQSAGGEWSGGTPAVDGGRLFIQEGNTLAGLDAATGKRLWTRQIRVAPFPGPTTLRAADGRVFVSEVDSVMAVDASNGTTIWSVHPDSQAVVETALDAENLYTGQRGVPVIYAFARVNGAMRWKVNLGPGYTQQAYVQGLAVSGDTVYATIDRYINEFGGSSTAVLVAVDRVDGHELWRYETPVGKHYPRGAPVPAGNVVVLNDVGSGDAVAIQISTRQESWRTGVGAAIRVRVRGAMVYTGGNRDAIALDLATGAVRWTQPTGSSSFGTGICGSSFVSSAFALRRFDLLTGAPTGSTDSGPNYVSHVASDGTHGFVTGQQGTIAFQCDP